MKTVPNAAPINGRSDFACKNWREFLRKDFLLEGLCYQGSHGYRDYRGRELEPGIAAKIVSGDIEDISASTHILVGLDQASWGTAMEIRMAYSEFNLPVHQVLASDKPLSPWLLHHATSVHLTLQDSGPAPLSRMTL